MTTLLYLSVFPYGVGGLDVDLIASIPEFSYLLFIRFTQNNEPFLCS